MHWDSPIHLGYNRDIGLGGDKGLHEESTHFGGPDRRCDIAWWVLQRRCTRGFLLYDW